MLFRSGEKVKWDIPLLEGYNYQFIKNNSWSPSIHKGFLGLQNWAVIRMLHKQPKSIIIIHGWAYLTNILAIVFGKIFGHTICLRAETPWNQVPSSSARTAFIPSPVRLTRRRRVRARRQPPARWSRNRGTRAASSRRDIRLVPNH